MELVLSGVIALYLAVGFVVLFRRLRRRGGPSLSGGGYSAEPWAFLAVAAFWPLYLREKAQMRPAESEDTCLSCHHPIPTGSTKCPACGWTWQSGQSGTAELPTPADLPSN